MYKSAGIIVPLTIIIILILATYAGLSLAFGSVPNGLDGAFLAVFGGG